ncbi:hypothetical protein D1007_45791 [Hordeum vulgare]|nr:hypothetical protein D1007_45791 [Hordeum vulgare]
MIPHEFDDESSCASEPLLHCALLASLASAGLGLCWPRPPPDPLTVPPTVPAGLGRRLARWLHHAALAAPPRGCWSRSPPGPVATPFRDAPPPPWLWPRTPPDPLAVPPSVPAGLGRRLDRWLRRAALAAPPVAAGLGLRLAQWPCRAALPPPSPWLLARWARRPCLIPWLLALLAVSCRRARWLRWLRPGKKKGPQPHTPAKQQKPGKGEKRPQDCFRCGSLEHFSRQCRAPKEEVAAYKAWKERETHLALVQEESPLAPPAAPVMIATPPPVPLVATSVVPIAAALAVRNDADVAMEVEHTVAPTGPPLDVDAATKMMTIEEGLTSLEIQAELDGFFAEST